MKKSAKTALSVFVFITVIVSAGYADWLPDGTPVCTADGEQENLQVCTDGAGGVIAVWEDVRNYRDIYAQRFDYNGNPVWAADGIMVCGASGSQSGPQICSDGAGGAIISWSDGRSGRDIYVQRVDANGSALWGADGLAVCTAVNNQIQVQIASDGLKGAVIVWRDERVASGVQDIYAQRVDSLGALIWTANGVTVCTQATNEDQPCITSDGRGGAIMAWLDYRSSAYNVYAQCVDEMGTLLWTTDGVAICTASGSKYDVDILTDGNYGAIVAWCDNRSDYDLYAQKVNSAGNIQWMANGTPICIAPGQQRYPRMISDGFGGAIAVWQDYRAGNYDVYVRMFNEDGDTLWATNGVAVCATADAQMNPDIVSDGSGGAIVTWDDNRAAFYNDVYAQRVNSSGFLQWTADGVALTTAADNQRYHRAVSDGSNGVIAVWEDRRDWLNTDTDLYVGGVDESGGIKTPATLSGYSAAPADGAVIVNWVISELDPGYGFFISRASGVSDNWRQLDSPRIDTENNEFTYVDRSCDPGKTYRYRVDLTDGDGRRTLFETDGITVPVVHLSLGQNSPNPFNPRTTIRFYLQSQAQVTLTVFDAAGRRVATLLDAVSPAGENSITWDGRETSGRAVSSGVYFYTLETGKQTLTKKMLLLK